MRVRIATLALAFLGALLGTASAQAQIKMVALGHSFFATQAGPSLQGYPEQLLAALNSKGYSIILSNAGVYGDTTDGVARRLDRAVPDGTDIVILSIGANDVRKGASASAVTRDVEAIISRLRAKRAQIILVGDKNSWAVQGAPDVTVIRLSMLDSLPPDMISVGHATGAGNAKLVELSLPAVEQVVAKVRQKR
jgi:lysophospholipase L1-like esterase